jgi:ketosteroid isomerase-like protein
MNRRKMISVAAALLGSGLVSLAGSGASSAEQSDTDKIKAAIVSFHAALTALDSEKMGEVWAHDADVMNINPRDKSVSVGWDAVSKNWKATFAFWSELKVTQQDGPYIHVNGDVAWADGIASVSGKPKTGDAIPSAPTFETNVFQKRGESWLLVSHSAWRVPQQHFTPTAMVPN